MNDLTRKYIAVTRMDESIRNTSRLMVEHIKGQFEQAGHDEEFLNEMFTFLLDNYDYDAYLESVSTVLEELYTEEEISEMVSLYENNPVLTKAMDVQPQILTRCGELANTITESTLLKFMQTQGALAQLELGAKGMPEA